jgi:hypothetical protein
MVELAGLDLMEGDDDILEEYDMFFSEGHGEPADDGGQDVQQLSHPVELVGFVDEGEETVVFGFADHFASGH